MSHATVRTWFAVLFVCIAATNWRMATSQAQGWFDTRVAGPVVCRAEFSLNDYDGLFRDLASVQSDLTKLLLLPPAEEPIEIYLLKDKRSFGSFLQQHYPKVPFRRALFVKGNGPGRVFVYRHEELAIDVRHEATHALLHAVLPMVPLWLDEGLAEYFEVPANQRAYDNPHLSALRWDLRLGNVPRLHVLEAKRDLADLSGTDYRHAWAWTHFMLHGPTEARAELIRFLGDIRSNTPPGKLSDRLERRLPALQDRLVRHFRDWQRP